MSKSYRHRRRRLGVWLRAKGSRSQHPVGAWCLVHVHRSLDAVSRGVWERLHHIEVGSDHDRRRLGICL